MAIDLIKILILCTGNSCRSQMAHGYLESMLIHKAEIYSAGIETHGLNSDAVLIMKEDGIDISKNTSNHVEEYRDIQFDYIITVCDNAKESCPVFYGNGKLLHNNFPDPSKVVDMMHQKIEIFRNVRNQIKNFCEHFIQSELKINH
jgi:arsenate reductase